MLTLRALGATLVVATLFCSPAHVAASGGGKTPTPPPVAPSSTAAPAPAPATNGLGPLSKLRIEPSFNWCKVDATHPVSTLWWTLPQVKSSKQHGTSVSTIVPTVFPLNLAGQANDFQIFDANTLYWIVTPNSITLSRSTPALAASAGVPNAWPATVDFVISSQSVIGDANFAPFLAGNDQFNGICFPLLDYRSSTDANGVQQTNTAYPHYESITSVTSYNTYSIVDDPASDRPLPADRVQIRDWIPADAQRSADASDASQSPFLRGNLISLNLVGFALKPNATITINFTTGNA